MVCYNNSSKGFTLPLLDKDLSLYLPNLQSEGVPYTFHGKRPYFYRWGAPHCPNKTFEAISNVLSLFSQIQKPRLYSLGRGFCTSWVIGNNYMRGGALDLFDK